MKQQLKELKELLEEADDVLAIQEDTVKGEQGDDITRIRGRIATAQKELKALHRDTRSVVLEAAGGLSTQDPRYGVVSKWLEANTIEIE